MNSNNAVLNIVSNRNIRLRQISTGIFVFSVITSAMGQNAGDLPVPNPYARTNLIHTSKGRQTIKRKLENIRLEHVSFDGLPLKEVVDILRTAAKQRDPEGKGINFLLDPNQDPQPQSVDSTTGLPVLTPVEPMETGNILIKIKPELSDVSLFDLLEAIIRAADRPLRYSIEDYAVVFRSRQSLTEAPLYTRIIKVDPNTFSQGLESVVGIPVGSGSTSGAGGGNQQSGGGGAVTVPRVMVAPSAAGGPGAVGGISGVTRPVSTARQEAVRQFLVNAGVQFTPGKSVFYTEREGHLLVRATLDDLDAIEKALGNLSSQGTQIK